MIHSETLVRKQKQESEWLLFEKLFGLFAMLAAIVGYALMIGYSQVSFRLNPGVNVYGFMLVRSISMLFMITIATLYMKQNVLFVVKEARVTLFFRSLIGVTGIPISFLAFQYLLYGRSASVIYYTKSLFVAAIAYFVLKEPYTKINWIASAGAFIGVAFYSYGKDYYELDSYYPIIFVCISTISFTIVLILTRIMNRHLHPIYSPFYFSLFLFFIGCIGAILYPKEFSIEHYEFFDMGLIFGIGVISLGTELSISSALKYENATLLAPVLGCEIVVQQIFNSLFFNYHWNMYDYIGGFFITASISILLIQRISEVRKIAYY